MKRIFRKVYKYRSGRVIIKSDVPLGTTEIAYIIDIINKVVKEGNYEPCYHISREVYDQINVSQVEANYKSKRFFIRLLK